MMYDTRASSITPRIAFLGHIDLPPVYLSPSPAHHLNVLALFLTPSPLFVGYNWLVRSRAGKRPIVWIRSEAHTCSPPLMPFADFECVERLRGWCRSHCQHICPVLRILNRDSRVSSLVIVQWLTSYSKAPRLFFVQAMCFGNPSFRWFGRYVVWTVHRIHEPSHPSQRRGNEKGRLPFNSFRADLGQRVRLRACA
eukprot:CAMPEP_0174831874 /NCGR_PEP_ID=MMETSP1114-20130205/3357_1 /TAXON_ID=312471 /ORGANISM="Neobodo designis, Strain CCAP 1951/1" /LENGTH=195 /DNA_ID=CAMNT_0016065721 /DNA_START=1 /DNA_END=588 /DNA_ORIENTATION=+